MNVPSFWKLGFCFLESFAFVTAAFQLMMNGSAWEAWMAMCGMLYMVLKWRLLLNGLGG
jgi:hypothetical protein